MIIASIGKFIIIFVVVIIIIIYCTITPAPDNKEELFVGHTDRYIGVYRWTNDFSRLELRHRLTLERQVRRERGRDIIISL